MSDKMSKKTNNMKRNETPNEKYAVQKVGQFRRFLAQFAATTAENMLIFDMGLSNSFTFIVIPALTGILNEHNAGESLSMTAVQASWLGSIGYVFEPVGSILSAFITDYLGRKSAMIIVNIPMFIAWFIMYNANSITEIFIAVTLLGLGAGLMESPIITYVGEICEPKFRGLMIAYTHVGWTFGMLLLSVLNTLMPWRTAALVCLFVPVLTTIVLCFVPETPLWLLSKNRTAQAEKSLCWLRGWVSREAVADELIELQRYSERYKSCASCIQQKQECSHPLPSIVEKMTELKRKPTLKPFSIVMSLFLISTFSGILAMTPFIVQIFKAYETPIAPDRAAALLSFVNNLGNIVFLCLIRFTGKRYLYLTMLTMAFLCSAVICAYGFIFLPSGYNSFDRSEGFSLQNKTLAYIPFICIILWSFCSFCCVFSMPWQMLSEVFPYKTRGMATGLTAALNYVLSFISTKLYYNMETSLSMPGVALFNCIIIALGLILMYKILPETEDRSLEDIEVHFSDNSKRITDRHIPKIKTKQTEFSTDGYRSKISNRAGAINGNDEKNGRDNQGFTSDDR